MTLVDPGNDFHMPFNGSLSDALTLHEAWKLTNGFTIKGRQPPSDQTIVILL
jgi:hypothetical protein